MEALFTALTHAIEGTPAIALSAAFAWGILSILLSPCHLASIPLIVGFIDDQGRVSTRHTFLISILFAVGILITIGVIGAITALSGRMMGYIGGYANYPVAVVFFFAGLYLLDVIPISLSGVGLLKNDRKGMWAAFFLGLICGVALGPCTFAFMAPMLGAAFSLSAMNMVYGVFLLLFYGIGHCTVLVVAGTSTGLVQQYLNWTKESRAALVLKWICGLLVMLSGLYMVCCPP